MDFCKFQNETTQALKEKKLVLLHAPTDIGKSIGSVLGFAQSLPKNPRTLLPMRALANSVAKDMGGLLAHQGFGNTYSGSRKYPVQNKLME